MNASVTDFAPFSRHSTYIAVVKLPSSRIPTIQGTMRSARRSSTLIQIDEIRKPPYRSNNVTMPHRSANRTLKMSTTLFSSDAQMMSARSVITMSTSMAINAPTRAFALRDSGRAFCEGNLFMVSSQRNNVYVARSGILPDFETRGSLRVA